MDRETLIRQVKDEYARRADLESRDHFTNQTYLSTSPEAYYERRLEAVIKDIDSGKYDHCQSGIEVVETAANRRSKLERICNQIESTLSHMETTENLMTSTTDNKQHSELQNQNERRAQAVSSMIHQVYEEKAQEDLTSGSSNVIGGGNQK